MADRFNEFMKPLKETHFSLSDYVDFPKVIANVEDISINLNLLNYLIGQSDMASAVRRLWDVNPKAFSVLDILIAVRTKDYFNSPEQVVHFLDETGLTEIFKSRQIKNLVDYVFGIEVGLDSNARKNRGGHIMESLVANILTSNGIPFEREVYYTEFPEIVKALGADNKRFDFVIRTPKKIYLIEANFYSGGGSKLNEVARSYSDLALKINAIPGYEFVWITDGNFDNQAKVKTCHEYILLYAKNANKFDFPNLVDPNIKDDSKLNNQLIRNTIVKNGPKNPVQTVILKAGFPAEIENAIFKAQTTHWPHHKNDIIVENYHVKYDVEISSGWRARAQLDQFMIEENKWNPVKDTKNQNTRFVLTSSGGIDCIKDRGIKSHVISVLQNLGGTQTATSELESLGICGFRYPKPTQLLEYILQLINDKDCWVLDFYAGTGTTGHAVTNLNFKDGGTRKYILVQFPAALPNEEKEAIKRGFKKISDITIARNKAVIEKTKASFDGKLITPEDQQQLDKLGFKVFTLSKSSFPRTDFTPDPEKSEEENLELFQQYVSQKEQQLSMPFDDNELITEILISRGFMLTYKLAHQTMFTANTVYLATDSVKTAYICVDNQLANATVDYFMQHTETKFICIERALDSTKKFNLKKKMGDKFFAF